MSNQNSQPHKRQENDTEWLDEIIKEISSQKSWGKFMIKKNNYNLKDDKDPVDAYYECLSYCDINPKGIDEDCESICIERHLKGNLW